MAIRALLLSADPQAVPALTQVLKELDLAFEHCNELSSGTESLAHQHFDTILVDCDNEQDAVPVFESVRGSTLQKTSITIAIVEGKTGVPNAFHLGAMLVLTKPVSVEQARNTLRTALSMLRKEGQAGKGILENAEAAEKGNAVAKVAARSLGGSLEPAQPASETIIPKRLPQLRSPAAVLPLKSADAPAGGSAPSAVAPSVEAGTTNELPSSFAPPRTAIDVGVAKADLAVTAAPTALPSNDVPLLDDKPILAELEESESKIAVPAKRAHAAPTRRHSRTPLLAAVVAVLLVAVLYAAWGVVPRFRDVVTFEYQKIQLHIAGFRTKGQTAASAIPAPSPSQATRSAAMSPGGSSVTPAADTTTSSADATAHPVPATTQSADPGAPSQSAALSLQNVKQDSTATNNVALVPATSTTRKTGGAPSTETPVLPADVADDNVVHRVSPIYPQEAKQKKVHGPVVLQAMVDKDGDVDFVKVVDGNDLLISAAVDAVRQWRYKPYVRNGEAVAFVTQVTVDFRLP